MNEVESQQKPGASSTDPQTASLLALALFFLRLGVTAFGGPAAHIAMMEEEAVHRRHWLSHEQFLDYLGAANLIPGPSSTELAIYIGYQQAGRLGLLVAGCCFILPASLIVLGIAWTYVRYGSLPQVAAILYGVKPVIIAVIVQAVWRLGRTAVKTGFLGAIGLACLAAGLPGLNPLLILSIAGVATGAVGWWRQEPVRNSRPLLGLVAAATVLFAVPLLLTSHRTTGTSPDLAPVFLFFVKVGAVVYGSGYVLLAFLRDDLVARWHWLTSAQLLDAVAVGQITPGPVFTTATFIGYVLRGLAGALVATAGIFLPGFLFVGVSGPFVKRLRESPTAGAFLDGVTVASLALMAVVAWQLALAAIIDPLTAGLAVVSSALLLRFRINSAWLVLAGALVGLVISTRLHP